MKKRNQLTHEKNIQKKLNYNCTTWQMAEQLELPLWKVMEIGKFFKLRHSEKNMSDNDFEDLLTSILQYRKIRSGKLKPGRVFEVNLKNIKKEGFKMGDEKKLVEVFEEINKETESIARLLWFYGGATVSEVDDKVYEAKGSIVKLFNIAENMKKVLTYIRNEVNKL